MARHPTRLWHKRYRRLDRIALLVVVMINGCTYERVVHDGWANLRAMADPKITQEDNQALSDESTASGQTHWAILLDTFQGAARHEQARQLIHSLQQQGAIPDLWMQDTGEQVHVFRGQYVHPDDALAENDLRQTRLISLEGQRPFASAQLIPVGAASVDVPTDPLDLSRFSGMYTLQIGFYDDQFGDDFRQAAQQAAATLREQGHDAYFYHGPHRSMVTVGLFTDRDFIQRGAVRAYGPEIEALQKKFPYNLGNGLTLVEKVHGKKVGTQPSLLVRVP